MKLTRTAATGYMHRSFVALAFTIAFSTCATETERSGEPHEEEAAGEPADEPAEPAPDVEREPIGMGITVGDVREASAVLAERARANGEAGGLSLAACHRLETRGLVARCVSLGALGGAVDRASFELPDPTRGRGVIQHFRDRPAFDRASDASRMFESEFGTFIVANERALLIFSGAERLDEVQREQVREIIAAL